MNKGRDIIDQSNLRLPRFLSFLFLLSFSLCPSVNHSRPLAKDSPHAPTSSVLYSHPYYQNSKLNYTIKIPTTHPP